MTERAKPANATEWFEQRDDDLMAATTPRDPTDTDDDAFYGDILGPNWRQILGPEYVPPGGKDA